VLITNANGTLAFNKGTAVTTTSTTQLRFWVYNTNKNGIKIYTHNSAGVKSTEVNLKPTRNKWVEVIVTLSQLGNPSTIQKVTIQNNATAATTMYFDDIKLANVIVSGSSSRASASVMQNEVDAELKNWRVFPNPAKDHVNIEFKYRSIRSYSS
jgi:hypothetical protein